MHLWNKQCPAITRTDTWSNYTTYHISRLDLQECKGTISSFSPPNCKSMLKPQISPFKSTVNIRSFYLIYTILLYTTRQFCNLEWNKALVDKCLAPVLSSHSLRLLPYNVRASLVLVRTITLRKIWQGQLVPPFSRSPLSTLNFNVIKWNLLNWKFLFNSDSVLHNSHKNSGKRGKKSIMCWLKHINYLVMSSGGSSFSSSQTVISTMYFITEGKIFLACAISSSLSWHSEFYQNEEKNINMNYECLYMRLYQQ